MLSAHLVMAQKKSSGEVLPKSPCEQYYQARGVIAQMLLQMGHNVSMKEHKIAVL
jgi:hypothetical protein